MSWAGRIVVLALAVLAVLLGAGRASAVHQNGLFELEGDAFNDPALPGDDWSSVNLGLPGGYFSHVFVPLFGRRPRRRQDVLHGRRIEGHQ